MEEQLNALLDTPVFDPKQQRPDEPRLVRAFRDLLEKDAEFATTLYIGLYFALLLCLSQQGVRIYRHCYFLRDKTCPWDAVGAGLESMLDTM